MSLFRLPSARLHSKRPRWRGLLTAMLLLLPLQAMATATVNKQFTPATVDPGDVSRFRISIFNSSLVPLTASAVTDNLPAQILIANPANPTDTCGFSTATAAPGTAQIILDGGTVPAGTGAVDGACYFEVDVVSTTPGNWPNTIPAGPVAGFTPGGTTSGFEALENAVPISNGTAAIATLSVRSLSPPTGNKTFSPSPAIVGEPTHLTIVLSNPNSSTTLPLTTFTDDLSTMSANTMVANPANATVSCTGTGAVDGTFAPSPGDTSLTLTGGAIGGGGTCTLGVDVVVTSITGTSQSLTNAVAANAIGNTRGLSSTSFNRSLTVNSPIGVTKSFLTSPVGVNQNSTLRIDITNSSTANPLVITSFADNLPAGLVVSATGTPTVDCVTSGGGTNGTLGAAPGATSVTLTGATVGTTGGTRRCRIDVPVTAAAAGSYVNTIAADAVVNPGGFHSPSRTATLVVNGALTVAKSVSSSNAAPGQSVTFTVTINNWSASAVSGVSFVDNLPSASGNQMVLSSPVNRTASAGCSGGTWTENPGDASISWSGGSIVGGNPGVCTITFRANPPAGAATGLVFTNSIPAGSITEGGGGSNGNSVSVNVTTVAAASVTKSFSPTSIAQGGSSQLTVTLSNATATPITNAAITDVLPTSPGAIVVAAVPNATTTCGGASVAVSAAPGDTSVGISGATIPANGNCNFRVNVTGNTVGVHANVIPANSLTNDQGATNPSQASANLTITTGLTATKNFTPTSVANGGISRVRITVTNASGGPLSNVSVVDGPMTNLTVAPTPNAVTTCAGPTVINAAAGANTAMLTGATLAAGANCDFLFDVLTANNPANWPNSLPAGAITSAEGPQNTGSVTATLNKVTTSIGINKSFTPVNVTGGQRSLLQIDVTNPLGSPSAANNVSFTDNFPVGMEIHAVPGASTTCTNGVVGAVPGDTKVTLSGATLAANSTCSVFVYVTSTKFLNLSNTIPVQAITSTQGFTNSLPTTATLSTLQGLGAMKSFAPTSISAGQTATLKIRLLSTFDPSASTPVTLTGVSFTDPLPVGMVVATTPNATTDCSGGALTAVAGASAVTLSGANILPGTNCTIQVDVTSSALGAYDNCILTGTVTSAQGVSNTYDSCATLNVLNPPVVGKSFSPTSVLPGTLSNLVVTINNPNTSALTGVALTDNLPAGLVIATTPNASTTCTGGAVAAAAAGSSIALTNATIPANGSCTFRADVLSNTPGQYTNNIATWALVTSQGISNIAPATASLTVLQPPTIAKAFSPATINTGGTSVLTLTLGNANVVATTLVSALTDSLPAGVTVASPSGVGGTCPGAVTANAGSGSVSYASGASVPAGGCTITVNVTAAANGSYVNTIPACALSTGAGCNAAPGTATLTVTTLTPPTIGKSFAPTSISTSGTSTLTLTLGNPNASAITLSAALTDTLPAGVVVASPAAVGGTCATGSVTATPGSGSVSYASGASIPAGGCTIMVNVAAAAEGTYVNTIGACALSTTAGCNAAPGTATLTVALPNVFDPPAGFKSVTAVGLPVLQWRMVWINNSNTSALGVRVVDGVPAGTTYVPGSLSCAPMGASTMTSCAYDAATNSVVFQGNIAPDPGATNEAGAANKVVITFQTTLNAGVLSASNTAQAYWDRNGDGNIDADIVGGEIAVTASAAYAAGVVRDIPVLSPVQILLLILLTGLAGWRMTNSTRRRSGDPF